MDFHNIYRKKWTTVREDNQKTIEALFVCWTLRGLNKCECFYEFVEHKGVENKLILSGIERSPDMIGDSYDESIDFCFRMLSIDCYLCDTHSLHIDEWRKQFTEVEIR